MRRVKVGDVWQWSYGDTVYHLLVMKEPALHEDWLCWNVELGKTQYWSLQVNDENEAYDWEQLA